MTQLNLFKYFKSSSSSPQIALPSPNGPLSREVPSTAISAANKEVEEVIASDSKREEAIRNIQVNGRPLRSVAVVDRGSSALHSSCTISLTYSIKNCI